MMLPPVVRLFFGIDLPHETKLMVGKLISQLKKQAHSNGIRWSKPENLHITLQFIAEAKREDIPLLMEKVNQHIQSHLSFFQLFFESWHIFPNPYRPRVIVLNVRAAEVLSALYECIGEAMHSLNYESDKRPFHPHLTLGRIKHIHDVDLHFLSQVSMPDFKPIDVQELILFRSEPQENGSHYIPLERIQLSHK